MMEQLPLTPLQQETADRLNAIMNGAGGYEHLELTLTAAYADLVTAFGKPNDQASRDTWKSKVQWHLNAPGGGDVWIYDYRSGRAAVRNTRWSVSSKDGVSGRALLQKAGFSLPEARGVR